MFRRLISVILIMCFSLSGVLVPGRGYAQELPFDLPAPGTMMALSQKFQPLVIKGLTVHQDNPFLFDFVIDTGDSGIKPKDEKLKIEADRLIKYFFACLTIPEKDLWVNLSPYEKGKIAPDALGQTALGRDLLAQDYILKQITASLIYPEKQLGREFWSRVYAKAKDLYGTNQIPVNTFNKVWILAEKAMVYEHQQTAFVVNSHLKVMLEADFLATKKAQGQKIDAPSPAQGKAGANSVAASIIREIVLPELEREVNSGKNFAPLRQIFNSLVLANWYKKRLKGALLNQLYADQSKVKGVDLSDPAVKQKIYQQYLQAYKKGVFNYIKEDAQADGQSIPRKYFSGGFEVGDNMMNVRTDVPKGFVLPQDPVVARVVLSVNNIGGPLLRGYPIYARIFSGSEPVVREVGKLIEQLFGMTAPEKEAGINALRKLVKPPESIPPSYSPDKGLLSSSVELNSLWREIFTSRIDGSSINSDDLQKIVPEGLLRFHHEQGDRSEKDFVQFFRDNPNVLNDLIGRDRLWIISESDVGYRKNLVQLAIPLWALAVRTRELTAMLQAVKKVVYEPLKKKGFQDPAAAILVLFYRHLIPPNEVRTVLDVIREVERLKELDGSMTSSQRDDAMAAEAQEQGQEQSALDKRMESLLRNETDSQFVSDGEYQAKLYDRIRAEFALGEDKEGRAQYIWTALNGQLPAQHWRNVEDVILPTPKDSKKPLTDRDDRIATFLLYYILLRQPMGSDGKVLVPKLSDTNFLSRLKGLFRPTPTIKQDAVILTSINSIPAVAKLLPTEGQEGYQWYRPHVQVVSQAFGQAPLDDIYAQSAVLSPASTQPAANVAATNPGPASVKPAGFVFNPAKSFEENLNALTLHPQGPFKDLNLNEAELQAIWPMLINSDEDAAIRDFKQKVSILPEAQRHKANAAFATVRLLYHDQSHRPELNEINFKTVRFSILLAANPINEPVLELVIPGLKQKAKELLDKLDNASTSEAFPGGIDLAMAESGLSLTKDAQGGVKVNFDAALINQIKAQGVSSVVPIIIDIRGLSQDEIKPLIGL